MSVRDPRDVLLSPVISEKSYGLLDENKYTFIVRPDANKTQIKIAVQQVFNVKVLSVNTINRQGKRKRSKGAVMGKRKDTKRAIVSVAPGDRIELFGGAGARRPDPPIGPEDSEEPWPSVSTSRRRRAAAARPSPTSPR